MNPPSIDLPAPTIDTVEEVPDTFVVAYGVAVMGASAPTGAGITHTPSVALRFIAADGSWLDRDVLLILTDEQASRLARKVRDELQAARDQAHRDTRNATAATGRPS